MSISQSKTPVVSVIMAVKNGGHLLIESVDSILNQTFTDFEFIIIDDGSTDDTWQRLSAISDPRVQIFSQENQGLARSLNRALALSTGKYIARQDHDDISLPTRLLKQVEFMEANPACGLVGAAAEIWDQFIALGRFHHHPPEPHILDFELIFNNPFVHTTWMFRSEVIITSGYYSIDPKREPPEDYEYVSRVSRDWSVANLTDILAIYRELPNSLSSQIRPDQDQKVKTFLSRLALISSENIAFSNGRNSHDIDVINFGALLHGYLDGYVGGSKFSTFKNLIENAAKNISLRHGCVVDKRLVKQKINSLRYQYITSQKVSKLEKFTLAITPDGFLHIWRLFKNKFLKRIYERVTGPGPRREKIKIFLKKIRGKLRR